MEETRFKLVSAMEKVLADEEPNYLDNRSIRLYRNDRFSFQLAFCHDRPERKAYRIKVTSSFCTRICNVMLVPSFLPSNGLDDEYYLRKSPGLFPDRLEELEGDEFISYSGQWRSLWITMLSQDISSDFESAVQVEVLDSGHCVFSDSILVNAVAFDLPPVDFLHTEWFHTDCLSNYYDAEPYSPEHWQAIENFMEFAGKEAGLTMLYTPIFTPALDTGVGGERRTVQLVDIREEKGEYFFDFEKLGKWCALMKKAGFEFIELSHLFTQWGARYAPKVIINGEKRFGWDTAGVSSEYQALLSSLIPQLKDFLHGQGFSDDRIYFHISDEPTKEQKQDYLAAKESVKSLIAPCRIFDALSSYEMYEEGIVELPVVAADHIDYFLSKGAEDLWVYYCVAQSRYTVNRFFALPSYRARMLGLLMYYYEIKGFLHWGFNFYSSQYSLRSLDPYLETDAGGAFPSGDPFLVYPAPDYGVYSSIRNEFNLLAFRDYRILKMAESRMGRKAVMELIDKKVGYKPTFMDYPQDGAFLPSLMEELERKS